MNRTTGQIEKYLTFKLAREEYGTPILKVREILKLMPISELPLMPFYMKGVINLRDHVIPVICLRQKFGKEEVDYGKKTCIIVVEVVQKNIIGCWEAKKCDKEKCPGYENPDRRCWMIAGTHCRDEVQGAHAHKIYECKKCNYYINAQSVNAVSTIGVIVDSVSEVLAIKEENIEGPPQFVSEADKEFILGMAKSNDGVKILIDMDRLFTTDEIINMEIN